MSRNQGVFLFLFIALALAQVNGNQENNKRVLVGDVAALGSSIQIQSNIKLSYEFQGSDFYILIESSKIYGWVGIGFGSTMTNTDMVIFFTNDNGQPSVRDAYSSGQITPDFDTVEDWILVGSEINSNSFKMKAKRAQNTNDSQDKVLQKGTSQSFCSAWSPSTSFVQHDSTISYQIQLDNNLGDLSLQTISIGVSENVLEHHKQWLFYGWGIVADIGIFVGRYLKAWKYHIYVHAFIFFALNVATIVFVALVLDGNSYKLDNIDNLDKNVSNHFIIGCIILALVILQHLGGIFLKISLEGSSKKVGTIKKFHLFFGLVIYALAKTNILIGSKVNSTYNNGIIISVISICALFLCEVFYRFYNYKTRYQIYDYVYTQIENEVSHQEQNAEYVELMRMLNEEKREPSQILAALPKLKWVIFNQEVYDVTKFVHPGGQFIIKEVIGREIGRYLLGALPLEGYNFTPYTHSSTAIKSLKKNKIGTLKYGESNILEVIGQDKQSDASLAKLRLLNPYKIVKVEKLSSTTSKFYFQTERFQIKNILQGVHWIGRHFQVKAQNQNKSRLYTQLNCMTDDNINLRNQLVDYAKKTLNNEQAVQVDVNNFNRYSPNLPLIIKKYDFSGALSKVIHDENYNSQCLIQGPLGIGLGFSELTRNKRICVLSAGTGILPFLDLFDFLLKKQLLETIPNHAAQLDPFNLEYNKYFVGCQFDVYSAFASIEDFIGKEWILYLNQLSKQTKSNLFNLSIKLSKGQIEGVDKIQEKSFGEFILNKIDNQMYDNIFICGPPFMYTQTLDALKKKGIEENKIHIV